MTHQARRGYLPEDDRWFSKESQLILKKASKHVLYLINEGYDLEKSVTFVGNHFLLSDRQRTAIKRTVCTDRQLLIRHEKECKGESLYQKTVYIDGFNQIITLETFLQKGTLLLARDGCIRDLAGLRGSYHLIRETDTAITLMVEHLIRCQPAGIVFYLDREVSNSGRLKTKISEMTRSCIIPVRVQLDDHVDEQLKHLPYIITSDSVILDACTNWYNLLADIIPDDSVVYPQ